MTGRARRALSPRPSRRTSPSGRISRKGRIRRTRPRRLRRSRPGRSWPTCPPRPRLSAAGRRANSGRPKTPTPQSRTRSPRRRSRRIRRRIPRGRRAFCPSRRLRSTRCPAVPPGRRIPRRTPLQLRSPSPVSPAQRAARPRLREGRHRPDPRYARWSSALLSSRRLSRPYRWPRRASPCSSSAWESSCLLAICSGRRR